MEEGVPQTEMIMQRNGVPQVQKRSDFSYEFQIPHKAQQKDPFCSSLTGRVGGSHSTPPPNLSSESQSGIPCKTGTGQNRNQNTEDSHNHGFRIDPRKQKGI